MNYYTMTNSAITAELGQRLEQLRLDRNIPQQTLADEIGITPKSYRQLVAGGGKIENLIAALRALNCLEQLDHFLPKPSQSPLLQLQLQGKKRKRARQLTYKKSTDNEPMDIQEPRLDW